MIAIFDTSSLLNLVKYYLPLDKGGEIKDVIKVNYEASEIRVVDKVIEECSYTAKGIILKELEFLKPPTYHIKTSDILPSPQFFNYVDNEFCDHAIVRSHNLIPVQVEQHKREYLDSADCKIMLYAQSLLLEGAVIVTEESVHGNDGKIHKKIPKNCKLLGVRCCTLPEFLNEYFDFSIIKTPSKDY